MRTRREKDEQTLDIMTAVFGAFVLLVGVVGVVAVVATLQSVVRG